MYEVRLWLEKRGLLKYVSHLDMFRTMQRAVRRAGIPLWYTEGFNPHPYISFLLALSLGVEGLREPVDLRIVGEISPEEIRDRLNAAFPPGLTCVAAAPPVHKPAEIAWAEYEARVPAAALSAEALREALECGALETEKTGKSGGKKVTRTVNVSEHILSFSVRTEGENTVLSVILPAGSTFNLNPLQLMDAVSRRVGRPVPVQSAVRVRLLRQDLSEFR